MADEITVVKVEQGSDKIPSFLVKFSEPVYLHDRRTKQSSWWCESNATDELGAFVWALKVIEEHKKREAQEKEQVNGTV